jgi:hypothetical protein
MLRYAFVAALVVSAIFAYLSKDLAQYKWSILLVATATYSLVTMGYLLYEVTHKDTDLGDLNHEKNSIGLALVIVLIYFLLEISIAFTSSEGDTPTKSAPPSVTQNSAGDWIYNTWGARGDCAVATKISRGPRDDELTIGPTGDVRKIIGEPTTDRVETNKGVFSRHPDGSMTSSEPGIENEKLIPCGT